MEFRADPPRHCRMMDDNDARCGSVVGFGLLNWWGRWVLPSSTSVVPLFAFSMPYYQNCQHQAGLKFRGSVPRPCQPLKWWHFSTACFSVSVSKIEIQSCINECFKVTRLWRPKPKPLGCQKGLDQGFHVTPLPGLSKSKQFMFCVFSPLYPFWSFVSKVGLHTWNPTDLVGFQIVGVRSIAQHL